MHLRLVWLGLDIVGSFQREWLLRVRFTLEGFREVQLEIGFSIVLGLVIYHHGLICAEFPYVFSYCCDVEELPS